VQVFPLYASRQNVQLTMKKLSWRNGLPLSAQPPFGTVTFTNSSTSASSYVWSYGDGITSTITTTTHIHTYTQVGVYTVVLAATGPVGNPVSLRSRDELPHRPDAHPDIDHRHHLYLRRRQPLDKRERPVLYLGQ
jgi:hypothetical protein